MDCMRSCQASRIYWGCVKAFQQFLLLLHFHHYLRVEVWFYRVFTIVFMIVYFMKVGMNFNPQLTVHNCLTPKPNSPTLIYLFYQVSHWAILICITIFVLDIIFCVVIFVFGNLYLVWLFRIWAIIFCIYYLRLGLSFSIWHLRIWELHANFEESNLCFLSFGFKTLLKP